MLWFFILLLSYQQTQPFDSGIIASNIHAVNEIAHIPSIYFCNVSTGKKSLAAGKKGNEGAAVLSERETGARHEMTRPNSLLAIQHRHTFARAGE